MATVELNEVDLKRIQAKIAGAGRALAPRILVQEVNRTAEQMAVAVARGVKADIPRLPYGTIRRRLVVVKARAADSGAEVRIRREHINLARFGARQTKRGGIKAVEIAGTTRGPFRHGFIIEARFPSPNGERTTRIAVERVRPSTSVSRGKRRSSPNLPLRGIYGSSVLEPARPHIAAESEKAPARLAELLARRIASELGKGR